MARRKRTHNEDGTFKADDPSTPLINEAWIDDAKDQLASMSPEDMKKMEELADKTKDAAQGVIDATKNIIIHAQAPEEAPVAEEPAVEPEAPVAVETPAAAAPVDTTALANMLAEKRKDPEVTEQPKDEGLKPMTEERLAEIRASAITPASVEKAGVEQIIKDAGVERTRGREIAARLMFNARKNGGFI